MLQRRDHAPPFDAANHRAASRGHRRPTSLARSTRSSPTATPTPRRDREPRCGEARLLAPVRAPQCDRGSILPRPRRSPRRAKRARDGDRRHGQRDRPRRPGFRSILAARSTALELAARLASCPMAPPPPRPRCDPAQTSVPAPRRARSPASPASPAARRQPRCRRRSGSKAVRHP